MRGVSTVLIVGVVLGWVVVSASGQARGGDPKARAVKNPVAETPASIAQGRKLYQTHCRHCHGMKGLGDGTLAPKNPSPPNLTDAQWDRGSSDGEIFAVIWNGAGPDSEMKPMKGTLTEANIWTIVNYLRSLGPKPAAP